MTGICAVDSVPVMEGQMPDYWLIDLLNGGGQGCYDSLPEALQAVADETGPAQQLDRLAVVIFNRDGNLEQVGHGEALLAMARAQFPLIGCRYLAKALGEGPPVAAGC